MPEGDGACGAGDVNGFGQIGVIAMIVLYGFHAVEHAVGFEVVVYAFVCAGPNGETTGARFDVVDVDGDSDGEGVIHAFGGVAVEVHLGGGGPIVVAFGIDHFGKGVVGDGEGVFANEFFAHGLNGCFGEGGADVGMVATL